MKESRLPFFALLAANAVSRIGNVVAAIAIPWFVLLTSGSAVQTGVAAFFATAPLAIGKGRMASVVGNYEATVNAEPSLTIVMCSGERERVGERKLPITVSCKDDFTKAGIANVPSTHRTPASMKAPRRTRRATVGRHRIAI